MKKSIRRLGNNIVLAIVCTEILYLRGDVSHELSFRFEKVSAMYTIAQLMRLRSFAALIKYNRGILLHIREYI